MPRLSATMPRSLPRVSRLWPLAVGRFFHLSACAAVAILIACPENSRAADTPPPRVIGIEGHIQVTLDRADYQPKPVDDRTPLILRIDKADPASDGKTTYDFHYIGFEPGSYPLKDYLIHPDGSTAEEIGGVMVDVRSILPQDHNGALNPHVPRPFPRIGGYRMLLGGFALVWVLGLAGFIWLGRRKIPVAVAAVMVPEPSYAERLRPLVEAAAAGALDANGQAELERLMIGYWRDKLALPDQRMAAMLAALKADPRAGALLRAIENWLHRPGGASADEITALLEPYRHADAGPSNPTQTRGRDA